MATIRQTFHLGGFNAAAPQQNRAELYDGAAGVYTSWDTAGVQTASRPLTDAEVAELAATDAVIAAVSNQASMQAKAKAALAANATFQARPRPTVSMTLAQQQQLWDQVQLLTKQCNALIRLGQGLLDDTSGT